MGGVIRRLGSLRSRTIAIAGIAGVLLLAAPRPGVGAVRAAYFYHYMSADHLERLAAAGFNRVLIHWIPDTLGANGAAELAAFRAVADARGLEVVAQWSFQQPARVAARPESRRYTWGNGAIEAEVPCPLDTAYWRSALLDRAEEFLEADPGLDRLAIDLELYQGTRHHYDAGPCRCPRCLAEYRAGTGIEDRAPRNLTGLLGWEEGALERRLSALLGEFAARHPGVELAIFDLDFDSYVHRALARALRRARIRTADYCERSYDRSATAMASARSRLDVLGLSATPLIGGLWLKRLPPAEVRAAVQSLLRQADGYFVFTTFSLWQEPSRLEGPYTLSGSADEYWTALAGANVP